NTTLTGAKGQQTMIHKRQTTRTRRGFLKTAAAVAVPLALGDRIARANEPVPISGVAVPQTAKLDLWMQDFMRRSEVPGAALAVTSRGRLVYARGFGFADVDARRRVEPDSRFRVASVTKAFTAAGVMQLV